MVFIILRGCLPHLNDLNILECECTYGSYNASKSLFIASSRLLIGILFSPSFISLAFFLTISYSNDGKLLCTIPSPLVSIWAFVSASFFIAKFSLFFIWTSLLFILYKIEACDASSSFFFVSCSILIFASTLI